jgi:hypothetical protein
MSTIQQNCTGAVTGTQEGQAIVLRARARVQHSPESPTKLQNECADADSTQNLEWLARNFGRLGGVDSL